MAVGVLVRVPHSTRTVLNVRGFLLDKMSLMKIRKELREAGPATQLLHSGVTLNEGGQEEGMKGKCLKFMCGLRKIWCGLSQSLSQKRGPYLPVIDPPSYACMPSCWQGAAKRERGLGPGQLVLLPVAQCWGVLSPCTWSGQAGFL